MVIVTNMAIASVVRCPGSGGLIGGQVWLCELQSSQGTLFCVVLLKIMMINKLYLTYNLIPSLSS